MNNLLKKSLNFNTDELYTGLFLINEPLKDKTTFDIGGNATLYAQPNNLRSLMYLLTFAKENSIPIFILGGGSNLVISDSGIDSLVISTLRLKDFSLEKDFLVCEAGCTFDEITKYCIDNSISGLEEFSGLPGTAGGAVFMNARCYNVSISDVISSVKYVDCSDLSVKTYEFDSDDWDYKKSPFQTKDKIIIEVTFKVKKRRSSDVFYNCESYRMDREVKGQFRFPSAGSVFKNNRDFGKPSGQIIDEVGLCGYYIGGAQVAPWHGNFIINMGSATATDVKNLVEYVQQTVQEKTGFLLECEIIFTDNL